MLSLCGVHVVCLICNVRVTRGFSSHICVFMFMHLTDNSYEGENRSDVFFTGVVGSIFVLGVHVRYL